MISKNPMKHMAIIPARLASTRLPNKPLQKICDKTLIEFVADEVIKTGLFSRVYVATDAQEIFELFQNSEAQAVMTSVDHESGTDRIFEAAEKLGSELEEGFDSIINIQGDEPFVFKEDLEKMTKALESGFNMVSFYEEIKKEDLNNMNKVKVILNNKSEAIYFSRHAIPFSREEGKELDSKFVGKHVGLYGYSKSFLKNFCEHPVGYHEQYEKLEQLRALQIGERIKMIKTSKRYQGVDTKEDLEEVNRILKTKGDV